MNKKAIIAVAGVMMLTGCQSVTYTQYMDGPPLEYAQAKCSNEAMGTERGYAAYGDATYVALAGLGNALENAARAAVYMKNCMAMNGWRQDPVGTKKAAPQAQAAMQPTRSTAKGVRVQQRAAQPSAYQIGAPHEVRVGM